MAVKIVSTKIPRTGSQSFGLLLRHFEDIVQIPMDEYFLDPVLHSPDSLWYSNKALFLARWKQHANYGNLPEGSPVIHAHHPIEMYQELYPDALRVVWLRHPVPLTISCYFFAKQLGHIPQNLTIHDYVRMEYRQNWMTLYTAGDLSQYDFVGISECFSEDIWVWANMAGWDLEQYGSLPRINKGKHPEYSSKAKAEMMVNSRVLSDIFEHNKDDFDLYAKAISERVYDISRQSLTIWPVWGSKED